jgi:hypothetical protein
MSQNQAHPAGDMFIDSTTLPLMRAPPHNVSDIPADQSRPAGEPIFLHHHIHIPQEPIKKKWCSAEGSQEIIRPNTVYLNSGKNLNGKQH